jgi:hypothetical protein
MANVLNSANRPVDLDDGRTLAPGEEAKKVDLAHPHNKTLIEQGLVLQVSEPKTQSSREPKSGEGATGEETN